MRKLVLTVSLLLLSASAQAGSSRGLTLAAHDATAEQPKPAQQVADQPTVPEPAKPAEQTAAPVAKTAARPADAKTRHSGVSTEAQVIYELHRHGIYW